MMKRSFVVLIVILLEMSMLFGCGITSIKQDFSNKSKDTFEESKEVYETNTISNEVTLDNYKYIISHYVETSVDTIRNEAESVLESIGDSFDSYTNNKAAIDELYELILTESEKLYPLIINDCIECYRQISKKCLDNESFDWDSAMDDIYDVWDKALDTYYEAWDNLLDEIYDKWDKALEDNNVDYSEKSKAWSEAYEKHSSSWSASYDAHSSAWSELYDNHSAVWSGFYSKDFDVNKIIEEAKEKRNNQEENQDTEIGPEDTKEEISTEENYADVTSSETKSLDSAFNPQDVSDATIESIQTYGDYLKMYDAIINDYFAKYESITKGTILYSEDSFKQLKNEMNKSFDEQNKAYDSIVDRKIIGKDTLVEFLKNYRNGLQEYIDSLAESLK